MSASPVLYSILIFFTSLAGGVIPLLVPNLHENRLKLFVCLGAGLLLGMGLLHMMPESAHLIPNTFAYWFVFGFVLLLILERFVMVHPCEEKGCSYHTVGIAAFLGLVVHGVIEGFALASSLVVGEIGPFVLLAILSHKAPQGFALTTLLKLSHKTKRQILGFIVGVSLSGPLGVALAYGLINADQLPGSAGILLAVSSGTFLYIGACDLLPELHSSDTQKRKRLMAFLLGLGLAVASGYLLPEYSHHH